MRTQLLFVFLIGCANGAMSTPIDPVNSLPATEISDGKNDTVGFRSRLQPISTGNVCLNGDGYQGSTLVTHKSDINMEFETKFLQLIPGPIGPDNNADKFSLSIQSRGIKEYVPYLGETKWGFQVFVTDGETAKQFTALTFKFFQSLVVDPAHDEIIALSSWPSELKTTVRYSEVIEQLGLNPRLNRQFTVVPLPVAKVFSELKNGEYKFSLDVYCNDGACASTNNGCTE